MWSVGQSVPGLPPSFLLPVSPVTLVGRGKDPGTIANCADHAPGSVSPWTGLHSCRDEAPASRGALYSLAGAGSSALPQATEAWAEEDVSPHLKATGVFMRPSRGGRHYNKGLHV